MTPTLERRNHGRGHSYWINGQKVPGITTILRGGIPKPQFVETAAKDAAGYAVDHWDELAELTVSQRLDRIIRARREKLTAAGVRGTNVHRYAEQLQAGEEIEVPDEYDGFVQAYLAFDREWQPREIHVERPFFHVRAGYAGTPDLVADLADSKRWLLDWKTTASGIWPEYALQLAAARYAEVVLLDDGTTVPVPEVERAGCVWLKPDGSYELQPCEAGPDQFRVFLHAKAVAEFTELRREDLVGDTLTPPQLSLLGGAE